MTHRWSTPLRPDLNNTLRTCGKCGLVRNHTPRAGQPAAALDGIRDGRPQDSSGENADV